MKAEAVGDEMGLISNTIGYLSYNCPNFFESMLVQKELLPLSSPLSTKSSTPHCSQGVSPKPTSCFLSSTMAKILTGVAVSFALFLPPQFLVSISPILSSAAEVEGCPGENHSVNKKAISANCLVGWL